MSKETIFNLNDSTIAQIAKCLQIAILTVTDIADNLRQLELEMKDDGKVGVTDNYLSAFESNLEKMMSQAQSPVVDNDKDQLKLFKV